MACECLPDLLGVPQQTNKSLSLSSYQVFAGHEVTSCRQLCRHEETLTTNECIGAAVAFSLHHHHSTTFQKHQTTIPSPQQTRWTKSSRCSARTSTRMLLPPPSPPLGLPAVRNLAATPTTLRALSCTPTLATSPSLSSRIRPRE
jgi:hypothetical protein